MNANPNLIYYDHLCFVLSLVCLYICVCECLFPNNNHRIKHKNNTNCRSAFEPGASGLPYHCASICVRSCCNWRASSVDSKPKKKGEKAKGSSRASTSGLPYKPKTKNPKTRSKENKPGLSPNILPEEHRHWSNLVPFLHTWGHHSLGATFLVSRETWLLGPACQPTNHFIVICF